MRLAHETTSFLSPPHLAYLHSSQTASTLGPSGASSFLPNSRMATSKGSGDRVDNQLPPAQQLREIAEFIDTTTRLSAEQLHWLAFMEKWQSPEDHGLLDAQIEQQLAKNVELLGEAMVELHRQGTPIKIGHPETGQSVPIRGLSYSTEQPGYQVGIDGAAPETMTLVPLYQIDQLHI